MTFGESEYRWQTLVRGVAATAVVLSAAGTAIAGLAEDIEAFTGARTRIVWAKAVTSTYESDVFTSNYALQGFDTHEGFKREILTGPISCANPWITPDGLRVIYSDWPDTAVYIVDWNGQNKRYLFKGFALCVLDDSVTGTQWVYASDIPYGNWVKRYEIDSVENVEPVWDNSRVSIRFRVSADGTRGGGEFPWPSAGVVGLPNGTFSRYGSGCNAMLAPDNSYRFFHLLGGHHSISMYDSGGGGARTIAIDDAPGVDGLGAWIPKWSSDVRFLTVAAPHMNALVKHDVHLGQFDSAFTDVTEWLQVTDTPDSFECYAYAWIAPIASLEFSTYLLEFTIDDQGSGVTEKPVTIVNATGVVPALSAQTSVPWLLVTVSDTGASQELTNTIDTDSLESGIHAATITVTGTGVQPATYTVRVRIDGAAQLARVAVMPAEVALGRGDSIALAAYGYDQFGDDYATAFEWSLSGGGAVSDSGMFTSDGDTGTFVATAQAVADTTQTAQARLMVFEGITVLQPEEGEVYRIGDTLRVQWRTHVPGLVGVAIELSPNDGRRWILVNAEGAITYQDSAWEDYAWVVDDSIYDVNSDETVEVVSEECLIRVRNYDRNAPGLGECDGLFTIARDSIAVRERFGTASGAPVQFAVEGGRVSVNLHRSILPVRIRVFNVSGDVVDHRTIRDPYSLHYTFVPPSQGLYVVRLSSPRGTWLKRAVVAR